MTVRNVKKNLAAQQDMLPGVGPYTQLRRGVALSLDGPAKSYIELWKRTIVDAGKTYAGTFEDGCLVQPGECAVSLTNGKMYSWGGSGSIELTYGSTPESSGGIGPTGWIDAGSITLYSRILAEFASILGSGLVGFSYATPYGVGNIGNRAQRIVCVTDAPFNADPTFTADSSDAILAAIQWAVDNSVSIVWVPTGVYKLSKSIEIPSGVTVVGDGVDYWDTYRPDPARLLKSWSRGTHLVFVGTGIKNKAFTNLHNARPTKTVGGVTYPFTDFTNNDSVAGAPATAKLMSVAVSLTRSSQLKNIRVMVSKDGLDGYNDASNLTLGDDWDIGVHTFDSNDANIDNLQVVGYWRVAGLLTTENDGSYTFKGNPERTRISKVLCQGRRGIIVRNSPQIDVLSNTPTTVTCKYNSTWTLTASNQFTVPGSSATYTFTGYSVTGNEITLAGVAPALPAGLGTIRAPNQGNNFSGTVFVDCVFCSLDHTSGTKSVDFGIGEAGAFEIDGYPMRNLKFINSKFQTSFDRLNGIWGDCRDTKLIACEHENGVLIAYSLAETQGYTGNIRYINSDIQGSVDTTAYNPRDSFDDYKQFPTRFTDGSFAIKNWRAKNLAVQWYAGYNAVLLDEANNRLDIRDNSNVLRQRIFGASGGADYLGANHAFKNAEGSVAFTVFGESKNAVFNGNASPAVANTGSVGTVSIPWANGAFQTAPTITSDSRTKTAPVTMSTDLVDAVLEIFLCQYKLLDRLGKKGDEARWHHGAIAQQVLEVFTARGLNPRDYAFFCHDKWELEPAILREHPAEYDLHGMLVKDSFVECIKEEKPAGELYSLRYEELIIVLIESLKRRDKEKSNIIADILGRLEAAGI